MTTTEPTTLDTGAEGAKPYRRRQKLISHELSLATSLDLLDTEGPTGLSMRKLAAELGVSLPTVYATIGSREQLVQDLLVGVTADLVELTSAPVPASWLGDLLVAVRKRHWFLDLLSELDRESRASVWNRVEALAPATLGQLRQGLAAEPGLAAVADLDGPSLLDIVTIAIQFADRMVEAGWSELGRAGTLLVDLMASVLNPGLVRSRA